MFWKKKQFWGSIIAVALLAFCVKDISLEEYEELAKRLDYYYLIPSILCSFLYVVSRAFRWRLMILQQKSIKFVRSLTLYSAGQIVNIVMPALTGQVGRLFLFSKNEGLKKTFVFSTIVLEVLFDSISLIIFLFLTSLAFGFEEKYRSIGYIICGATIVLIILLYLILHFQTGLENICRKKFRDRWPGFYISLMKFIRSFIQGIRLLRSSQHFLSSLAYSIASWIFHALAIYFLLRSFGHDLPFAAAASVMIINTLALMIPITPGNAGTFETAVSFSLTAFSVPRTDAVLFALVLHLIDFLPIIIMGYIYLHIEKISIKDIKSTHEEDKVLEHLDEEGSLIEKEESV